MSSCDRGPLADAPMMNRIRQTANNRLGADYSALHGFWSARHAAINGGRQSGVGARRDAYSIILFDQATTSILTNDFTSTPDQLLNAMLAYGTGGGSVGNWTINYWIRNRSVLSSSCWSFVRF